MSKKDLKKLWKKLINSRSFIVAVFYLLSIIMLLIGEGTLFILFAWVSFVALFAGLKEECNDETEDDEEEEI